MPWQLVTLSQNVSIVSNLPSWSLSWISSSGPCSREAMMSPVSLKLMATSEPVEPGVTTSSTVKPASGVKRSSIAAGASAAGRATPRRQTGQDQPQQAMSQGAE